VKKATNELGPNEILRKRDGHKYFGYKHTTLDDMIKAGEIPAPIKLGARARGWTGAQIIEWQARLIKNAAK
jgi:predicted DNA-binding transcriptional regulator AlpA